MSNKTTAMWANTRVSEWLGIKDAKGHVLEIPKCCAQDDLDLLGPHLTGRD
jgi:hypothetical protein